MRARGARVARALKMPFPILAAKLTQRGRALPHRLVADTASAWRTNGVTVELLRAWRAGARSRFFVHPADRSALIAALQAYEPEAAAATVVAGGVPEPYGGSLRRFAYFSQCAESLRGV